MPLVLANATVDGIVAGMVVAALEAVLLLSLFISLVTPAAGLPSELHESVDGSRFRKLTPNRELASSTDGSVVATSFECDAKVV